MQTQTAQPQPSVSVVVSDPVISAVPGKFYSYSTAFTPDRPLCYLMDCKANKSRPMIEVENYAHELDLVFTFENGVQVYSPDAPASIRLLADFVASSPLNRSSITSAPINAEAFYELRGNKDVPALVEICNTQATLRDPLVPLTAGSILAVTTRSGKYGLLLIKEVTPSSIAIDACHILLQAN